MRPEFIKCAKSVCLTYLALAMAGVSIGCASTPRASRAAIPSVLTAPAEAIEGAHQQLAALWPGFWTVRRPYILSRKGIDALAMTSDGTPSGFERLSDDASFGAVARRPSMHIGPLGDPLADAGLSLSFPVPGGSSIVVAADTSVFRTVEVLLHESFHAYQASHFVRSVMPSTDVTASELGDETRFASAADRERQLLVCALAATSPTAREAMIRRFLQLREQRLAGLSDRLVSAEEQTERIEGSANYIGFRGALSALAVSADTWADTLTKQLRRPLDSYPQLFGHAAALMRWRLYGTGAAQLTLLDKLGIAWREPLAGGASPSQLLRARPAIPLSSGLAMNSTCSEGAALDSSAPR